MILSLYRCKFKIKVLIDVQKKSLLTLLKPLSYDLRTTFVFVFYYYQILNFFTKKNVVYTSVMSDVLFLQKRIVKNNGKK